jgi:hypothetical protein
MMMIQFHLFAYNGSRLEANIKIPKYKRNTKENKRKKNKQKEGIAV